MKIMGSLIGNLNDRQKLSSQKEEEHSTFLKKMAETDEEALLLLTQQNKLMDILKADGN
jgi:light-regulated signal transduction histidine kinase (bacteriophytochrome)